DLDGRGAPVTFYGHDTTMPSGPAALALMTGRPLLVGASWRTGRDRFEARAWSIDVRPTDDRRADAANITQAMARRFEEAIAMAPLTPSVGGGSMRQLQRDTDAGRHLDAIELMNPSAAGRARQHARRRLNAELLHLPGIGSSDAHVVEGIGTAWTWFPGASAE